MEYHNVHCAIVRDGSAVNLCPIKALVNDGGPSSKFSIFQWPAFIAPVHVTEVLLVHSPFSVLNWQRLTKIYFCVDFKISLVVYRIARSRYTHKENIPPA